jgi:hypothetical protein
MWNTLTLFSTGVFGGHPLDGLDHDALGLLVRGQLGFLGDVLDVGHGGGAGLVLQALHQCFLASSAFSH